MGEEKWKVGLSLLFSTVVNNKPYVRAKKKKENSKTIKKYE